MWSLIHPKHHSFFLKATQSTVTATCGPWRSGRVVVGWSCWEPVLDLLTSPMSCCRLWLLWICAAAAGGRHWRTSLRRMLRAQEAPHPQPSPSRESSVQLTVTVMWVFSVVTVLMTQTIVLFCGPDFVLFHKCWAAVHLQYQLKKMAAERNLILDVTWLWTCSVC